MERLQGVAKVIDELGLMILTKEIELELKEKEIADLKRKIETIESYLDMYEEHANYDFAISNQR